MKYNDPDIEKDDIFNYVYGVLHAPTYRDRFGNDLAKGLPRVPFASDFRAFVEAGTTLSELHLGYETLRRVPAQHRSNGPRGLPARALPPRHTSNAVRRRRQVHAHRERPRPNQRDPRRRPTGTR